MKDSRSSAVANNEGSGEDTNTHCRLIIIKVGILSESDDERIEKLCRTAYGCGEFLDLSDVDPDLPQFDGKPLKRQQIRLSRNNSDSQGSQEGLPEHSQLDVLTDADVLNAAFLPSLVDKLKGSDSSSIIDSLKLAHEKAQATWAKWKATYDVLLNEGTPRPSHNAIFRSFGKPLQTGKWYKCGNVSFSDVKMPADDFCLNRDRLGTRYEVTRFSMEKNFNGSQKLHPLALCIVLNDPRDIETFDSYCRECETNRKSEAESSEEKRPIDVDVGILNGSTFHKQITMQEFRDTLLQRTEWRLWRTRVSRALNESMQIDDLILFSFNDSPKAMSLQRDHLLCDAITEFERQHTRISSIQLLIKGDLIVGDSGPESASQRNEPHQGASFISDEQHDVANRILESVRKTLAKQKEKDPSAKALHEYRGVRYIILVPAYLTLKVQTLRRIRQDVDENASEDQVFMYDKSERSLSAYEKFRSEAVKHPERLFVIIADESHWGPLPNSAHDYYVNDANHNCQLLRHTNVIVLQVSATPYCNLTRDSRIPIVDGNEANVVTWYPIKAEGKGRTDSKPSMYVRLEHMLMSIPSSVRHDMAGKRVVGQAETEIARPLSSQQFRPDKTVSDIMARNDKKTEPEHVLLTDYVFSLTYFAKVRWNNDRWSLHDQEVMDNRSQFVKHGQEVLKWFRNFCLKKRPLIKSGKQPGKQSGDVSLEKCSEILIKAMVEEARAEIVKEEHPNRVESELEKLCEEISEVDAISWVLWNKYKLEEELFTSSDQVSWFSETDRIVLDLLLSPARGWGHMKIVRVFDMGNGDYFRRVLQECRDELFELTRESDSDPAGRYPPFAVVPDFGNTKLSNISTSEAAFRTFVLSQRGQNPYQDVQSRDSRILSTLGTDVTYLDLEGLPCVLILCEKGRMGDTFPQSFDCLDLRIRASDNTTTLVQELGRLCRYPKTRQGLREPLVSFGPSNPWSAHREAIELVFEQDKRVAVFDQQDRFAGYASHFEPWHPKSTVAIISRGRLSRSSLTSNRRIDLGECAGSEIFPGDRFGVRSGGSAVFRTIQSVDRTGLKVTVTIDDEPFPAEICGRSDMTEYFILRDTDSLQSLCERISESGKILELEYALPYALIRPDIMKKLEKAVDTADNTGEEIWKCIQLKDLDQYMQRIDKGKKLKIDPQNNPLHDYRKTWKAATGKDGNFDAPPGDKKGQLHNNDTEAFHARRFLLFAECQIGKTGAYCTLLNRLKNEMPLDSEALQCEQFPIIPSFSSNHHLQFERQAMKWALPYWKDICRQTQPWDLRIKPGKYHPKVRLERIGRLLRSVRDNTQEWLKLYCDSTAMEECVQSALRQNQITDLEQISGSCPLQLQGDSCSFTVTDQQLLQTLVDWDCPRTATRDEACSVFLAGRSEDPLVYPGLISKSSDRLYVIQKGIRLEHLTVQHAAWGTAPSFQTADSATTEVRLPCPNEQRCMAEVPRNSHGGGNLRLLPCNIELRGKRLEDLFPSSDNLKVSIPNRFLDCFEFNTKAQIVRAVPKAHVVGASVHGWVFTPTYGRHLTAENKAPLDRRRVFRSHSGVEVKVVQVLVVRADDGIEKEFSNYCRDFGSEYIVVAMPPTIDLRAMAEFCRSRQFTRCGTKFSASKGGVGYARLFSQLLAFLWELPWIWMVDDNVQICYSLDLSADRDMQLCMKGKPVPCTFADLMVAIEQQVGEDHDTEAILKLVNSGGPYPVLRISDAADGAVKRCPIIQRIQAARLVTNAEQEGLPGDNSVRTRSEFAGSTRSFAVIGMGREVNRYMNQDYRCPFKVTHSVYSLFLLNVQDTVMAGVFYPAKTFWEDIDFHQLCEERGLTVLKCKRFFHHKKNLQPLVLSATSSDSVVPSSPQILEITIAPSQLLGKVEFERREEWAQHITCREGDRVWDRILQVVLKEDAITLQNIMFIKQSEVGTSNLEVELDLNGFTIHRLAQVHHKFTFGILFNVWSCKLTTSRDSSASDDLSTRRLVLCEWLKREKIKRVMTWPPVEEMRKQNHVPSEEFGEVFSSQGIIQQTYSSEEAKKLCKPGCECEGGLTICFYECNTMENTKSAVCQLVETARLVLNPRWSAISSPAMVHLIVPTSALHGYADQHVSDVCEGWKAIEAGLVCSACSCTRPSPAGTITIEQRLSFVLISFRRSLNANNPTTLAPNQTATSVDIRNQTKLDPNQTSISVDSSDQTKLDTNQISISVDSRNLTKRTAHCDGVEPPSKLRKIKAQESKESEPKLERDKISSEQEDGRRQVDVHPASDGYQNPFWTSLTSSMKAFTSSMVSSITDTVSTALLHLSEKLQAPAAATDSGGTAPDQHYVVDDIDSHLRHTSQVTAKRRSGSPNDSTRTKKPSGLWLTVSNC